MDETKQRMKRALRTAVVFVLGISVGFALGFALGVPTGINQEDLARSSSRAAGLTGVLHSLRSGPEGTARVIDLKEQQLDDEILTFGRLEKEGLPWLLQAVDGPYDHEKNMRKVAEYRKQHASWMPPPAVLEENSLSGQDRRAAQETIRQQVREILRPYEEEAQQAESF